MAQMEGHPTQGERLTLKVPPHTLVTESRYQYWYLRTSPATMAVRSILLLASLAASGTETSRRIKPVSCGVFA
jgi:hypothetical protein